MLTVFCNAIQMLVFCISLMLCGIVYSVVILKTAGKIANDIMEFT